MPVWYWRDPRGCLSVWVRRKPHVRSWFSQGAISEYLFCHSWNILGVRYCNLVLISFDTIKKKKKELMALIKMCRSSSRSDGHDLLWLTCAEHVSNLWASPEDGRVSFFWISVFDIWLYQFYIMEKIYRLFEDTLLNAAQKSGEEKKTAGQDIAPLQWDNEGALLIATVSPSYWKG